MGFEGFPLIVGWELTLACNLRCRHCGSSAALPRRDELSLEECLTICDQLPALLVQEVDFTGGEPLLRPGWSRIATHLGELGIRTKLLTNGLTLGTDTIAQLKDAGIAGLGVSIDGLEATHDYVRDRAGLFQQAVAGMEQARKAGLPVSVITTVNALNIDELPALFALLRCVGVEAWQVQPIFPLGRGQAASELRLTEQAYMQLGAFVKEWSPSSAETGTELMPGDSFGYFTDVDTREPPWRGCSAGLTACGITSDGKIKGCLSLPDELVEGDLRQKDLWEIWFGEDAFAYTRRFSIDDVGPSCQGCDMGGICKGGCSAMSYACSQRFHNDPYCFYGMRNRETQALEQPTEPSGVGLQE
jgi:radical SAM protein with 4Fe4S-binding SPASM domain